jgi:hypothetical protein
MSHARSIGFILSLALVGAAGCGRSSALSVPNGAVVGTEERPTAVANCRDGGGDAITAMALDAGGAPFLLDAGAAPDVAGASSDAADASPALPPNDYRVIQLAVGRTHNCVILDDHKVKCWGDNGLGQLGYGDQLDRGADPSTMGDNLPTVDLGTGRTAKSITGGRYATCAILDDDELKCWGQPFVSTPKAIDLGAGRKPAAVAMGFYQVCVARDDGSFLCWDGNVSSTTVAAAADGARVVQLAQDYETVGLFDDGSVRRISLDSTDGPTPVDFGGPATFVAGASTILHFDCAILRTGGTACTATGSPPIVPTDASVVAIAITEYEHACGLDAAGVVTCWNIQPHPEWGDNAFGTVRVPLGQAATAIGAGDDNGCALLADGTVKCWDIDGDPEPVPDALGGSVSTSTGWPAVDLGTRPAP